MADPVALGCIHQLPPVQEWHIKWLQILKYSNHQLLPLLNFHLHRPARNIDPLLPYQWLSLGALYHLIQLSKDIVPLAWQ